MFDNPSSIHTLAPLVIGALWALLIPLAIVSAAASFLKARARLRALGQRQGGIVDHSTHTTQVLVLVDGGSDGSSRPHPGWREEGADSASDATLSPERKEAQPA